MRRYSEGKKTVIDEYDIYELRCQDIERRRRARDNSSCGYYTEEEDEADHGYASAEPLE